MRGPEQGQEMGASSPGTLLSSARMNPSTLSGKAIPHSFVMKAWTWRK